MQMRLLTLLLLALLAGCGAFFTGEDDDGERRDGSVAGDGGVATDGGGTADAGGGRDAGSGSDAGGGRDAGGGADAGGGRDAGPAAPCDGWQAASIIVPNCGPAPLTATYDAASIEQAYVDNGCTYWGTEWDFGDGDLAFDESGTHTWWESGDYAIGAYAAGECCDAVGCFDFNLDLTDVVVRAHP